MPVKRIRSGAAAAALLAVTSCASGGHAGQPTSPVSSTPAPSVAAATAVAGKAPPDIAHTHPVSDSPATQPPSSPVGTPSAVPGQDDGEILTAADIARLGLPLPFPFEELKVSTEFLAVMANTYVGIYSGVSRTDPTQGVIIVASQAADSFRSPFASPGLFTEANTGALSITKVVGPVVTLKDAHGALHTLNIQTQAFS